MTQDDIDNGRLNVMVGIAPVKPAEFVMIRWRQENSHKGPRLIAVDVGDGRPSRWNTLRGLRVLTWWESP
jgi:hypothetical protein